MSYPSLADPAKMAPHLLSMPLEVRCMIYQNMISADDLVIYANHSYPPGSVPYPRPVLETFDVISSLQSLRAWGTEQNMPIFMVCKQLYDETLPFFQRRLPIMLDHRYMTGFAQVDQLLACVTDDHRSRIEHLVIDWRDKICEPTPESCQCYAVSSLPALDTVSIRAHFGLGRALQPGALDNYNMLFHHNPNDLWDMIHATNTQQQVTLYTKHLWQRYRDYSGGRLVSSRGRQIKFNMLLDLGFFQASLRRVDSPTRTESTLFVGSILVC